MKYDCFNNIFEFNWTKQSAFRKKNQIPRSQRKIDLKKEVPGDPQFYSFIDGNGINNETSLISGAAYSTLINRLSFADVIPRPVVDFQEVISQFDEGLFSADEKMLIKKMIDCGKDKDCMKALSDTEAWQSFTEKYRDKLNFTAKRILTNKRENKKKECLQRAGSRIEPGRRGRAAPRPFRA